MHRNISCFLIWKILHTRAYLISKRRKEREERAIKCNYLAGFLAGKETLPGLITKRRHNTRFPLFLSVGNATHLEVSP